MEFDSNKPQYQCIRDALCVANMLTDHPVFLRRLSPYFLGRASPNDRKLQAELVQIRILFRATTEETTVAWTLPSIDSERHNIYLNQILEEAAVDADGRHGTVTYARTAFYLGVTILHELVHLADVWFRSIRARNPVRPPDMEIPGYAAPLDAGSIVELAIFGGTASGLNFTDKIVDDIGIRRPIRLTRRPRPGDVVAYKTESHHLTNNRLTKFLQHARLERAERMAYMHAIPRAPYADEWIQERLTRALGPV